MGAGASQDSSKPTSTQRSPEAPQPATEGGGGAAAASPSKQNTLPLQEGPTGPTTEHTTTVTMSSAGGPPLPPPPAQQPPAGGAAASGNHAKTQDELDEEEWQREKERLSNRLREKREKEQGQRAGQPPPPPPASQSAAAADRPPAGPPPASQSAAGAPTGGDASATKKKRLLNGTDIEHRYPSGSVYRGSFKDGKLHGYGVYRYHPSGDVYEGEWVADMKHGHGSYRYDCGDLYTGEWRAGKKHGKGTYRFASGDEYVGSWKEDKIHGHGVFHIARNGNRYEGNWVESYRHGYGVLYCGNGDVYQGNWTKGKEDGAGVLTYANGNIYAGDWKTGQQDGKGILVENGQKYTVENIGGYLIAKVPVDHDGVVDPDWNAANRLYLAHIAKMEADAKAKSNLGGAAAAAAGDATEAVEKITAERDMWMRRYENLLSSKGGDKDDDDDETLDFSNPTAVRARFVELKQQRAFQQRRADETEQRLTAAEARAKEAEFEAKRVSDELAALRKSGAAGNGEGGYSGSSPEMDKMQRRIADLERELAARKQGGPAASGINTNDPVQLKAQLELLEGEVRHLRSTREELQKVREQNLDAQRLVMNLEAKNEELLKEINVQRQRAQHASNETTEDLNRQISAHRDEIKDLHTELQDIKVKSLVLEDSLKKTKQRLKESEEKALRVSELEAQVVQLTVSKSSQSVLQDKRTDELESLRQKNAALLRQLEELQADPTQRESAPAAAAGNNVDKASAALQAQLAELQAKNESLASDLKRDKKKTKKLAAERDELVLRLAATQSRMERAIRAVESATAGRITNIVCIRPPLPSDRGGEAITLPEPTVIAVAGQDKFNGFDLCVAPDVQGNDALLEELRPLVRSVAQGFNAAIVLLGPMNAGKTTFGSAAATVLLQDVFRAVDDATKPKGQAAAYTPAYHATCVELTSDGIFDLSNPQGSTGFDIRIALNSFGSVVLDGATEVPLQLSRDAVVDYIGAVGRRMRKRSHIIYTLHVTLRHKVTDACIRGKLVLADLAGQGSLGDQEDVDSAKYINQSLVAFGNVVTALADGHAGVPYRDDRLTQALADALGGNCRLAAVTIVPPVAEEPSVVAQALGISSKLSRVECRPRMQLETAEFSRLRHIVEQTQSAEVARPVLSEIDTVRD